MRTRVQRTVSSCFADLHQLRQIRRSVRFGCLGALPPGLRQRSAGRYPSVFNASTPVSSEGGDTDDRSSQTLWSYHRCSDQPALATSPGAHRVQDCRADVQSSTRQRAVIPGTSHSPCRPTRPTSPSLQRHKRLLVPPYRLSTVGSRSFPVAAILTSLIRCLTTSSQQQVFTLQTFQQNFKTLLLRRFFFCISLQWTSQYFLLLGRL